MKPTKDELYKMVDELERRIEVNEGEMIEYQDKISALGEMNKALMARIRSVMKKVREMES